MTKQELTVQESLAASLYYYHLRITHSTWNISQCMHAVSKKFNIGLRILQRKLETLNISYQNGNMKTPFVNHRLLGKRGFPSQLTHGRRRAIFETSNVHGIGTTLRRQQLLLFREGYKTTLRTLVRHRRLLGIKKSTHT